MTIFSLTSVERGSVGRKKVDASLPNTSTHIPNDRSQCLYCVWPIMRCAFGAHRWPRRTVNPMHIHWVRVCTFSFLRSREDGLLWLKEIAPYGCSLLRNSLFQVFVSQYGGCDKAHSHWCSLFRNTSCITVSRAWQDSFPWDQRSVSWGFLMCVSLCRVHNKAHSHVCSQLKNTHVCVSQCRVRDKAHSHECSQQRNTCVSPCQVRDKTHSHGCSQLTDTYMCVTVSSEWQDSFPGTRAGGAICWEMCVSITMSRTSMRTAALLVKSQ